MNRSPVISSNIASIGYDHANQVLEIEFKNGSLYQYYGVSDELHRALIGAESHGVFFNQTIKGRFGDRRVG